MLLGARALSVRDFGTLSVGVAIAAIVQAIVLYGFDVFLLRELASNVRRDLIRSIYLAKATITIFAVPAAVSIYIALVSNIGVANASAMVFGGVLMAAAETPETVLASQNRYTLRTLIQSLPAIGLISVLGICFALRPSSITISAFAFGILLREVVRLGAGLRAGKIAKLAAHRVVSPYDVLRGSAPFAAVSVLGYLYFRLDTLVLQAYRGSHTVAYYSAAYLFLTGIGGFITAIGPILLTDIARSPALYFRYARRFAAMGVASALCMATGGWFLLPELFGSEYTSARLLVVLLALTLPFSFSNSVSLRAVYALRLERQVPRAVTLTTLFNLGANVCLIPAGGAIASALITVASEALLAFCFRLIILKSRKGEDLAIAV